VTCVVENEPDLALSRTAAARLLDKESLVVEREREGKVKRVDIRPYLHSISADDIQNGRIAYTMVLGIGMDGVAKPQEIVAFMANDVPGLAVRRIHRARLLTRESGLLNGQT
jgi:hypothetical protein